MALKRVITVKIDDRMWKQLELWARIEGISKGELVRRAIEYYLRLLRSERATPKIVVLTS